MVSCIIDRMRRSIDEHQDLQRRAEKEYRRHPICLILGRLLRHLQGQSVWWEGYSKGQLLQGNTPDVDPDKPTY